jgi:chromosome partitioning protein
VPATAAALPQGQALLTVVANLKGGTGKSTVAFNLAVWLASNHREVTALDLDPQSTLFDVVAVREEEGYAPAIEISRDAGLLDALDPERQYLVDCGVAEMNAMMKALGRADRVIVPVAPSQADIWSTQRFAGMVAEANAAREQKPQVLGFINRADTHLHVRETDEAESALTALRGIDVIDVRLYQRTAYRRSFSEGLAVFELEPNSKAAAEINKLATIVFSSLFILKGGAGGSR